MLIHEAIINVVEGIDWEVSHSSLLMSGRHVIYALLRNFMQGE
jgi:hypothetical protein